MISIYLSLVDTQSDKDKVEYIYLKYYGIMSYVAGKYVTDKDCVADIVHDSMVKIIYNIEKINIEDEVRTKAFCTTVVKHKAIDFLRKKELNNISLDDNFDDLKASEDVFDIVVNDESCNIIINAIDSLSDIYQTVCKLKYINGLKEREIAEMLDLPLKTVSLRIFRGKKILRDSLVKENLHG